MFARLERVAGRQVSIAEHSVRMVLVRIQGDAVLAVHPGRLLLPPLRQHHRQQAVSLAVFRVQLQGPAQQLLRLLQVPRLLHQDAIGQVEVRIAGG